MKPLLSIPDVDWIAAEAGVKPANRLTVGAEHLGRLRERAAHAGFVFVEGERTIQLGGRPPEHVVYLARSEAHARELATVEAEVLPGGPSRAPDDRVIAAHTRVGALLGFPACCVAAFCERLRRGVTRRSGGGDAPEDVVATEDALLRSVVLLGRLNHLLPDRRARLISFYPCRFDCAAAAEYAQAAFRAVERASPEPARALRSALIARVHLGVDGSRTVGDAPAGEHLTLEFAEF